MTRRFQDCRPVILRQREERSGGARAQVKERGELWLAGASSRGGGAEGEERR